jgi:hypothetical protein
MPELERLVQQFVGVWNETDPSARRATIEALWAPDGRHLMGEQDVNGYEALEARVMASHERNIVQGGNVFRPATAIQALPEVIKFRWDMARKASGEVVAAGVGFLRLNKEGQIVCDYLFAES